MGAFVVPSIFTAIDKFTAPVEKMGRALGAFGEKGDAAAARVERRFRKIGDATEDISKKSFLLAAAVIAPLALAANAAIKFEDKLADVAKTTGLAGTELSNFGKDILKMSGKTRTSIDDLLKIAEIGGQAGIANDQLVDFTESVNQFNVALGADFSGGVEEATAVVSKMRTLFKETNNVGVAKSINMIGSAINELGAKGSGTSANISDFANRVGALPSALKPSLHSVLALGTFLEESGINSEIGSGGLTKFLLDAGNKMGSFSKQMGLSKKSAQELLAQDPTAFVTKFAVSLNKLKPEQLAKKLKELGIGSQESIKVLGALGAKSERFGELITVSSNAISEAISVSGEYNKKNETTAAKIERVKNQFSASVITLGEKLLPIISRVIEKIVPLIDRVVKWTEANPELTKQIIKATVALGALLLVIGAFSGVISIVSNGIAAFAKLSGFLQLIGGFLTNWIIPALQFLWAAISVVVESIGAFLGIGLAAFLLLISLVLSFVRNWDHIVDAFKNNGIIAGLKAIGATILDAILWPLQKVLELASSLPDFLGGGLAADAAKSIESFRSKGLGLDVSGSAEAINPKAAEQDALVQKMEQTNSAKVDINVNDPNGRVNTRSDNNFVKINTSSTMVYGMQ